jgi:hypothetical protein
VIPRGRRSWAPTVFTFFTKSESKTGYGSKTTLKDHSDFYWEHFITLGKHIFPPKQIPRFSSARQARDSRVPGLKRRCGQKVVSTLNGVSYSMLVRCPVRCDTLQLWRIGVLESGSFIIQNNTDGYIPHKDRAHVIAIIYRCMDVLKLSKPEIRKRKINGTTSCCRDCHTSRVLWVVPPIVLGLCCCGGLCCGGLCCG